VVKTDTRHNKGGGGGESERKRWRTLTGIYKFRNIRADRGDRRKVNERRGDGKIEIRRESA